jgi:ankyrin repeat protein
VASSKPFEQQTTFAETLLQAGANVNTRDSLGKTALHYAAQYANMELIEVLLNYKANVNIEDSEGNKPHEVAKKFNHVEAKRLISTYFFAIACDFL